METKASPSPIPRTSKLEFATPTNFLRLRFGFDYTQAEGETFEGDIASVAKEDSAGGKEGEDEFEHELTLLPWPASPGQAATPRFQTIDSRTSWSFAYTQLAFPSVGHQARLLWGWRNDNQALPRISPVSSRRLAIQDLRDPWVSGATRSIEPKLNCT